MYNQVIGVLSVSRNGLTGITWFAEQHVAAAVVEYTVPVPGRDFVDALLRMLTDQEGILDMLVKGRGSG